MAAAAPSLYPSLSLLPLCNSSAAAAAKPRSSLSFHPLQTLKPLAFVVSPKPASSRVFAAPELLESRGTVDPPGEAVAASGVATLEVGGLEDAGPSPLAVGADSDNMAPKQRIRIKLRSYWVPLIEDSCKQIMDAARTTNAKTMGPIPLPTKKRVFCVLKSPHVHKDARFHFEIRTHQRLIDILYPTAQTIDSLMQLDLPAGVDVEVKL
uniref:Small ribosomal subunit protein uS10c n=1 Tax=Anthurium amnicola TaxID=1678845 RepID=A0A1D1YIW4_9ARAE